MVFAPPLSVIRRGPLAALPLLVFVAAVTAGDIRRLPSGRAGSTASRYAHTLSWTGSRGDRRRRQIGRITPVPASIYFGGALAWSPQADTWRELSTYRAPSPRAWHSSVWSPGMHLIVWGGQNAEEELATVWHG